ncbi:MAG: calcium/sodium antiporter [Bacteroidota bacterium]
MLLWSTIFIITLVSLVIAADFFIKAAERIGLALGIEPFIVGVTLIAVGTSLPELVTSIVAVLKPSGTSAIVPGNVIGSNITNTCLVLGIVGVLAKKVRLEFDIMQVDLPMLMGSAFIMYLCCMDAYFSLFEGIICLGGLVMYLMYVLSLGRNGSDSPSPGDGGDGANAAESNLPQFSIKDPLILLASGLVIYFSAEYNVTAIIEISEMLDIGKELIALTAVALGTSLPELVVSVVAVRSGNAEMAIGNILGSNIFNVFAVMGIPRLFGLIDVPPSILDFSLPAMIVASLIALLIVQDRIVNRWEGFILLLLYVLFMGNLIGMQI